MYINYNSLLFFLIISIGLNFILVKSKFFKLKNINEQIQDIHFGNPSRLGGLVMFSLFFLYEFIYLGNLYTLFWASLIIILPALFEDLRISVNPFFRLLAILISSLIIIINFEILPYFNFGYLNIFFNNHIFQIIFFTVAMSAVINGQNIVDGTNGLSAMTSASIFGSLLFLGFYLNDEQIIDTCSIIITLLIGFLVFNYPYGKIFLGDTGSYFLGLLSSYMVIKVFASNPELPSWSAVIILFYPALEVTFSYFRKILNKKSPFLADNLHLHYKIYNLISKDKPKSRLFNALVTPFLGIIWLSPLALLPFSIQYPLWSISVLIFLIIIYLFFYISIPNYTKK